MNFKICHSWKHGPMKNKGAGLEDPNKLHIIIISRHPNLYNNNKYIYIRILHVLRLAKKIISSL